VYLKVVAFISQWRPKQDLKASHFTIILLLNLLFTPLYVDI